MNDTSEAATKLQLEEEKSPDVKNARKVASIDLSMYTIDSVLGQGSSGIVFKGTHKKLGRLVAIKMLRPEYFKNIHVLGSFRQEAQIISRIKHENIASVYDFVETKFNYYIIMEFIEGIHLTARMNEGKLDESTAIKIIIGLLEGLRYSHNKNILHLDLKPSNILLNEYGEPVIVDFGLSQIDANPNFKKNAQILGTPYYMAPEQYLKGQRLVESRSDLYSLGVILYQLLTQKLPFEGENLNQIRKKVLLDDPILPSQINSTISPELEAIILKLLEKQPSGRYLTAQEVIEDINRYQRGEPVKARGHRFFTHCWNWLKKNPAVTTLTLLVITVAVSFLYYFFHIKNQETPQWKQIYTQNFSTEFYRDFAGFRGLFDGFIRPIKEVDFQKLYGNRIDVANFRKDDDLLLLSKKTFDDNTRLEFEWTVNQEKTSQFGFFINTTANHNSRPNQFGYLVHFNGQKVNLHRDSLNSTPLWKGSYRFEPNKNYSILMEAIDGHIKISVDEKQIIEFQDFVNWFSKKDHCFGFFAKNTDLEVDNIKVSQLNTALLITPLDIGNRFFQLDRFDDAIEEYSRVISKYPHHKIAKDAYYFRGLAYKAIKDYKKSLRDFDTLISDPKIKNSLKGKAYYQQAVSLIELSRIEEATSSFLKAMDIYNIPSLQSNVVSTVYELGIQRINQGTLDSIQDAEKLFTFLSKLNIPSKTSYVDLPKKILLFYFDNGYFKKAIETTELIQKHYTIKRDLVAFALWKKAKAYTYLAQINKNKSKDHDQYLQKAIEIYHNIIKTLPEIEMYCYFSYDELAKIYRQIGKFKEANSFERHKLQYKKSYGILFGE